MNRKESKKLKEIREAYERCKEVFAPGFEIINIGTEIKDKEEYEFYRLVYEHFMHKRQRELIKKGVY